MKKLVSLLLTATLFLSLMLPALATSNSNPDSIPSGQRIQTSVSPIQKESILSLKTSSTGEQYLLNITTGEKIVQAYAYNKDGELIELPLSEYKRIKDSLPEVSNTNEASLEPELNLTRALTWRYVEKRSYLGYGSPIKVSADLKGPGKILTLESASVSCSFGGDVGIDGTIKKLIQASVSFTWNVTLQTQTTVTYEFDPIPSGKIGYVQFTPYFNVSIGDLYKGHSESSLPDTYEGEVWGQSPVKRASGFVDGLYELVIK